jgi:hypothetical protein
MKSLINPSPADAIATATTPTTIPNLTTPEHDTEPSAFHQSKELGRLVDEILQEEEKARDLARQVELERQRELARYD